MLDIIYRKRQKINVETAWTIDARIKYKLINNDTVHEIRSAEDLSKLVGTMEH